MTKTEFLQTMTPIDAKPTPEPTPAEQSLAKAGIPPDAPYYTGALRQVEQALASRKPTSEAFWKSYQLSLCAHLEQLEHTDKTTEQEMLIESIRTVQGILYALEQRITG